MKTIALLCFAGLSILLASCTSYQPGPLPSEPVPGLSRGMLVGTWMGDSTEPGVARFISQYHQDGRFEIAFSRTSAPELYVHFEKGSWKLGGNIMRTLITEIDGEQGELTEDYRIDSITPKHCVYTMLSTGRSFTATRVR